MNSKTHDSQSYPIQMICGCVEMMQRADIIKAGAEQQLLQVESGNSKDAIFLPSRECGRCKQQLKLEVEDLVGVAFAPLLFL